MTSTPSRGPQPDGCRLTRRRPQAEVEKAVARHPAVASCAVIGIPDEAYGERVHAVVVLQPGATLTAEALTDSFGEHIANYRLPRSVKIVGALPVSGAGKTLKFELRAAHRAEGRRVG